MSRNLLVTGMLVFCALGLVPNTQAAPTNATPAPKGVYFPTSYDPQAAADFTEGVTLLHNMSYVQARAAFRKAVSEEGDCAMGYWGLAMTLVHPVWADQPSREDLQQGAEWLAQAKKCAKQSPREAAYIAALSEYFEDGANRTEAQRLASLAAGFKKVYEQYPDDMEAAAFYSITLLSTASPSDKTYRVQLEAGKIAEMVAAKRPEHPGAYHYIIHSYDYPGLAQKALAAARKYPLLGPENAHALHMPTHIFTRLGYWDDSIKWNLLSAAAALKHPVGNAVAQGYFHASDYLTYAYLQKAQDRKACDVVKKIEASKMPLEVSPAVSYGLAAEPARYALERDQWEEAARIQARQPADYPWDKMAPWEAISHYAIGLGAARSHQLALAESEAARLKQLQSAIAVPYWKQQVEIQWRTVDAWVQYARDKEAGLAAMQAAADLEKSTEKHPITPGEVAPANEQYGDMLRDAGKFQEAMKAYQVALARSPNRFRSLFGMARSAQQDGSHETAKLYYGKLLQLARDADTARPAILMARQYLGTKSTPGHAAK